MREAVELGKLRRQRRLRDDESQASTPVCCWYSTRASLLVALRGEEIRRQGYISLSDYNERSND